MRETGWSIEEVEREGRKAQRRYAEFLRLPSMSAGVYRIEAHGVDPQMPHREDELYYVVRGKAQFDRTGHPTTPVSAGSILFVPKELPHRFHSIEEELVALVVFAPAESSPAGGSSSGSSDGEPVPSRLPVSERTVGDAGG